MLDRAEVTEDVRVALDEMFVKLADKFELKSGDVDPMTHHQWEEVIVPQIVDYVWSWYEGNYVPPKQTVSVVLRVPADLDAKTIAEVLTDRLEDDFWFSVEDVIQ